MRLSVRKKRRARKYLHPDFEEEKRRNVYNNIKAHDVTIYFSRSSSTIY